MRNKMMISLDYQIASVAHTKGPSMSEGEGK